MTPCYRWDAATATLKVVRDFPGEPTSSPTPQGSFLNTMFGLPVIPDTVPICEPS